MSGANVAHAHDAHEPHGEDEGKSSMVIETAVLVALLVAAGYALFGPKAPPGEHAEEHAANAKAASSARVVPSVRQPLLASSVLAPRQLAEMQAIQGARRAISQGKPDDALKELANYDKQFPDGKLADDVTLLRAEAHLKKGDRATAEKLIGGLVAKAPDSRQARRGQRLLNPPAPGAPAPGAPAAPGAPPAP